ncbi:MAG: hypothetical protein WD715_09310 [Dongiaceae bacterium]
MKIVKRIRDIHEDCKPRYELLATEVNGLLKPRVEEKDWFFRSRIKGLESFALKIETGRVPDPARMEDFFACTIVVPTMVEIDQAAQLVLSVYDHISRRPPKDDVTHKVPSSFTFDDLRLYVARRPLVSGKNPELDHIVFEVQIKTILQHAWSVSTHDLIFKSDTVSWPRERIAFQVKAMLEHAELAISEANRLADTPAIAKKDNRTADILHLIGHINRIWTPDRLPADIKRLAETIFDVFRSCDLSIEKFPAIIENEKRRIGLLPADLSPYALTVQALAHGADVHFERKFKRDHIRTTILIHGDMDLPAWIFVEHPRILNIG